MRMRLVHTRAAVPTTLVALLAQRAAESDQLRGFTFLVDGELDAAHITYAQLDGRARAIASRLRELGAEGERVLLLYPPGLEYICAFFGCLYAGAVAVPAYPPDPARLPRTLPRLEAIVRDARASIAVTSSLILGMAEFVFAQAPALRKLKWLSTETVDDALADAYTLPHADGASLAFLQYTSGSTGSPKGVMLSHANLLHNQELIREAFEHDDESVVVGWLPLYHDMGLIGNVLQPLYMNIPCILMSPLSFLQKPARWLQAISRYKATTSGGPNFAYDLCARKVSDEDRARLDLSHWRVAFNGAEPIRPDTLERFTAAFAGSCFRNKSFHPCYGLAESALIVAGGTRGATPIVRGFDSDHLLRGNVMPQAGGRVLVGCGRALLDERLIIVDPLRLVECGPTEIGEIWVASRSVATGYFDNATESARVFEATLSNGTGPFLRTGDMGFFSDGELFIAGRLKDLVIIRGRNHYPQDIELTVEGVDPALRPGCGAAFSIDEEGEERLAIVQEVDAKRAGDLADVIMRIRRAVAEAHEVTVRTVALIRSGSIPKTSSGKIQRRACRAELLDGSLDVLQMWPEQATTTPGTARLGAEGRGDVSVEAPAEGQSVGERLAAIVARQLRISVAELRRDEALTQYGLDSLAAIELQAAIETQLDLSVPMALLLEGVTLAALELRLRPRPAVAVREESGAAEGLLSAGQGALWFLHELDPQSSAFNVARAGRVRSPLDENAFGRALLRLTERHPAVRTSFSRSQGGGPLQRVGADAAVDFVVTHASSLHDAVFEAALAAEANRPFDLERAPLMRVRLWRSGDEAVLLFVLDHIVTDFWSMAVLLRELGSLYRYETGGEESPLPALGPAPLDFAREEAAWLSSPEAEAQLAYWKEALAGAERLQIPTDRPRALTKGTRGNRLLLLVESDRMLELKRLGKAHGATFLMTLQAVLHVVLHRYSQQPRFLVGTMTSGRLRASMRDVLGYFVNPLAIRADVSGDPTFLELLERVRLTVLSAYAHQELPFVTLVERMQVAREQNRSPLFDVVLLVQKTLDAAEGIEAFALGERGASMELGGLELESIALAEGAVQFELTLAVAETARGLSLSAGYDADLYEAATIERLLAHVAHVFDEVTRRPDARVSTLVLLTDSELRQLRAWNSTEQPAPDAGCVNTWFEQQASRAPSAIALIAGDSETTYGELDRRANRVAHRLRQLGVGPDVLVGVCLPRCPEAVVGLLGIMKAGGAYVPLDPTYPAERLAYMISDSAIRVLLTRGDVASSIPATDAHVCSLDDEHEWDVPATRPTPLATPDHLAYVIYTSGSSGQPKGVMVTHRGVVNIVASLIRAHGCDENDRTLQQTSMSFDVSVNEIFAPLCFGGAMVFSDGPLDVDRMLALVVRHRITMIMAVPSVLSRINAEKHALPSLRVLFSGGEELALSDIDALIEAGPIVNGYGPTETTVAATAFDLRTYRARPGRGIPIGKPLDNYRIYILDDNFGLLPIGVAGELYIAGVGVARGYLHRPDLTAEKFVPSPFDEGERMYRTGDLGLWLPDGNIQFEGRVDHQVKIRGFRIELGEIEARLGAYASVHEVVVVARVAERGAKRLVAYVVAAPDRRPTKDELKAHLAGTLPDYMIPSAFVLLDVLPLTPNGKIDRKALPEPEWMGDAEAYVAPSTPIEERLAALWRDALKIERVGVRDNFFELGGHSLLAMQVVARVRESFGVEVAVRDFFEAPTLETFAAVLAGANPSIERRLVRVDRAALQPLTFAQARMWMLHALSPESTAYHMGGAQRLTGPLDLDALRAALTALIARHETLRTVYPSVLGEPRQRVLPASEASLEVVDFSDLEPAARSLHVKQAVQREIEEPFDLERGPLFRTRLFVESSTSHVLVLAMHHIAGDGWSIALLVEDLARFYRAALRGDPLHVEEAPFQSVDLAAWQQTEAAQAQIGGAREFWKRELAGAPPLVNLPTDRRRPAVQRPVGRTLHVELGEVATTALRAACQRSGTTLFVGLLAGFAATLRHWTRQEDLVIGTVFAGRAQNGFDRVAGCFVDFVPLRVKVDPDASVGKTLRAVHEVVLGALAHPAPFEHIVSALETPRTRAFNPIYNTALLLQSQSSGKLELEELSLTRLESQRTGAELDLRIDVEEQGPLLQIACEYNVDLFDDKTIEALGAFYVAVLVQMSTET